MSILIIIAVLLFYLYLSGQSKCVLLYPLQDGYFRFSLVNAGAAVITHLLSQFYRMHVVGRYGLLGMVETSPPTHQIVKGSNNWVTQGE